MTGDRFEHEEDFHDGWAASADLKSLDVRGMNEASTAPEMRYIRKAVGDLRGKSLLDVGCGLGEASVYFAMEGAEVTAVDISQGMLDATLELARWNGVEVRVHKAVAEDLRLQDGRRFDIIYLGNLLHHVDIEATIRRAIVHLKPGGMLVSWDPVAYNPLINVYRRIAVDVRTKSEHPLRLSDIRTFRRHFGRVQTRWFWLSTLAIFVIMAIIERRNPNKERYWKKVVEESARWEWLYKPLERVDNVLLALLPFLRPLCWNVVVVCSGPLPGRERDPNGGES